jgi:peptidoglycan/xylan/chitin deacetylase (PgdA/CDA1 family)
VLDLMDWNELRQASDAGFTIGAHTVTHPYLTAIAETAAATEMRISRDSIEQRIGVPVTSFAYPYGSWNATVARLAGEIFERACTTELKPVTPDSHALSLPRLDAYYLHSRFLFENFRSVSGRTYLEMRRLLRNLRTANSVNPLRGSLCQSTPLPTP